MAVDFDKYKRLKRQADRAATDAAEAQGALKQLMEQLTTEFKCESLDEGEILLAKYRTAAAKAEDAYTKALDLYEEKWEKV